MFSYYTPSMLYVMSHSVIVSNAVNNFMFFFSAVRETEEHFLFLAVLDTIQTSAIFSRSFFQTINEKHQNICVSAVDSDLWYPHQRATKKYRIERVSASTWLTQKLRLSRADDLLFVALATSGYKPLSTCIKVFAFVNSSLWQVSC